jgi:hypothetical protein
VSKGTKKGSVKVRLLFVDEGSYHAEDLELPSASVDAYERLIDCLREDPVVLERAYVDIGRLAAAYRLD